MFHISEMVAGYIRSRGIRLQSFRRIGSYRRHPYIFATLPSFSHRFGAMAAGIAGQGWSGNVMTEEYGAATYLGTVVTDAVLQSDPLRYSSRHFVDQWCTKCRICDKVCVLGMFIGEDEEYILMNGELHPRAKRRDINLCNGGCFGLHGSQTTRNGPPGDTNGPNPGWMSRWNPNNFEGHSSICSPGDVDR